MTKNNAAYAQKTIFFDNLNPLVKQNSYRQRLNYEIGFQKSSQNSAAIREIRRSKLLSGVRRRLLQRQHHRIVQARPEGIDFPVFPRGMHAVGKQNHK